jgi:hypothetical protein
MVIVPRLGCGNTEDSVSESLLRATRYLRRHDKLGYFSTLALDPDIAEAWGELYVPIRRLDEESEQGGTDAIVPPAEVGRKLLNLRPELAPVLAEGVEWAALERQLYENRGARSVSEYFDLMYYRGFLPVYVASVLTMPEEDRAWLQAFAVYTGCGGQIIDDTVDLVEDIKCGRLFITIEEFDELGLTPADLGTVVGLRKITELRRQWALAYHLKAYRVTSAFIPKNRVLARNVLEFSMRALLDERVRPLPEAVLADQERFMEESFGIISHFPDAPWPSEGCRRAANRPFIDALMNGYAVISIDEAVARFERYERPLPQVLMIEQLRGMPSADLRLPPVDLPDARRPIRLVHYGAPGLLPTLVDVLRVMAGL